MRSTWLCCLLFAFAWSPQPPADASVLLDADRAFAADTAARGLDGWMAWFAQDALIPVASGALIGDLDELRAWYEANAFPPEGFHWWPEAAELADSGDYGYTVGSWELRPPGLELPEGVEYPTGPYLSVWERQPDGGYRVVTDTGDDVAFRTRLASAQGPPLQWSSEAVRTWRAASGEFVFVLGKWSAQSEGSTHDGRYISVWKRAEDGTWQVAAEIGHELPREDG